MISATEMRCNGVRGHANRIVNNWNSLPNHVVNAGSLNIFKNSLDRLWAKQDLLYNYRGVIDKKLYDISIRFGNRNTS